MVQNDSLDMGRAMKKRAIDRVREFNSLAEHDAANLKEGQITTQFFEGHGIDQPPPSGPG